MEREKDLFSSHNSTPKLENKKDEIIRDR